MSDVFEAEFLGLFDDALERANAGAEDREGAIIRYANEGGYRLRAANDNDAQPFDLDAAIPVYSARGMPAREFVGPPIGEAFLFPLAALSLFVALGGSGKTTAIIKIAAHIAAGKAWGYAPIVRRKVLVFCIEENQSELNRKFGSAVHEWGAAERALAQENLRLISCVDRDARLTRVDRRQVEVSGVADEIIRAATEFGATVICLDHLQGFVSGDLNLSDTATALARASNMIVAQTGAAVIQTAHISKGNIGAQGVLDGFTTGSLAFENAARQVSGVIGLSDDEAKRFGLGDAKSDYLKIEMPKNSYGPSRAKGYLRRAYVPDFHTITVEPYAPPIGHLIRTGSERISEAILDYVKGHPGTTPNKLETLAGEGGQFKASKTKFRDAVKELIGEGRLVLKTPSKEEREVLGVPHQAKTVYEYAE